MSPFHMSRPLNNAKIAFLEHFGFCIRFGVVSPTLNLAEIGVSGVTIIFTPLLFEMNFVLPEIA